MRPGASVAILAVSIAAGAALDVAPAGAWTPAAQVAIADQAAALAPPDLAQLIWRHIDQFRRGAVDAYRDRDPMRHQGNADGTGRLARVVAEEADRAVAMVRAHRAFSDVVYQLGRVSHYAADADNPLNASNADPHEGEYFADFLYYMDSARPRFQPVFYGIDPGFAARGGIVRLIDHSLQRSRDLYPLVGAEYRRVGAVDGRSLFDDRSTAFAVAALSFSHALSDVAAVLRDVWIRSGGYDPRRELVVDGPRLLLLPAPAAGR